MKINEFIVVEGRDDTVNVKRAVDCDTIETNGSALSKETIEVIRQAQEKRGVIILTDPDFPGDKIRNTIKRNVPGVKHAFIQRELAQNKRGKIGVEHASIETIRNALIHVSSPLEHHLETINKSVLIDLGLITGKEAKRRRNILCNKLNIGYSNGKQLLNKLNAFGYSEEDVRVALGYEKRR